MPRQTRNPRTPITYTATPTGTAGDVRYTVDGIGTFTIGWHAAEYATPAHPRDTPRRDRTDQWPHTAPHQLDVIYGDHDRTSPASHAAQRRHRNAPTVLGSTLSGYSVVDLNDARTALAADPTDPTDAAAHAGDWLFARRLSPDWQKTALPPYTRARTAHIVARLAIDYTHRPDAPHLRAEHLRHHAPERRATHQRAITETETEIARLGAYLTELHALADLQTDILTKHTIPHA